MLPSILAKQLEKGIGDYIETTFPMTNDPFKGSIKKMLGTKDSVYHEPFVSMRLPFRVAEEMPACFEAIHPAYLSYVHHQIALDRLTGDDGRSTKYVPISKNLPFSHFLQSEAAAVFSGSITELRKKSARLPLPF